MILTIDGNSLNISKISNFLNNRYSKVVLSKKAEEKIKSSYENVVKIINEERPVYGITTGFGSFADVLISREDAKKLQENLIKSHAAGTGNPFDEKLVLLIMLLRANALAKGYSGISPTTLNLLLEFINKKLIPYVPKYGSVGASGDLAPLSHIALALIGKGEIFYKGKKMSAHEALHKAGLKKIRLHAKEGLALTNGTQMMSAVLSYACSKFETLYKLAIISSSMSVEALLGSITPFDSKIHNARPHKGQKLTAFLLTEILKDSQIVKSHENCSRIQDAYTLRCIPQVYGACFDTYNYVKGIVETEINSATDNPLIFDENNVLSGGNFHGEPVAFGLDFLALAFSELGNMIERRIDRMLNSNSNKTLPPFLTEKGGLNSGFMIAQYTAAALVSENKLLCHPASSDSIPTSANQEDHVSMGSIGAVKILKIIENLEAIISIELLCSCQALEFHKNTEPCAVNSEVLKIIRKKVPFWEEDGITYKEIENIRKIIYSKDMKKIINNLKINE
ncbi:MAG: histidine ammonia-lyase [Candidatus Muiribacteriota bacterium]